MIGNALLPVLLSIAAADSSSPDSIDRMRDVEAEVISNLTKADRQALRSSNIPAFDVDVSEFQSLRVRTALCIPWRPVLYDYQIVSRLMLFPACSVLRHNLPTSPCRSLH